MATRIEFHKHGGPDVLNAVEFTPPRLGEMKCRLKIKPSALLHRHLYSRRSLSHRRHCRAVWVPRRRRGQQSGQRR